MSMPHLTLRQLQTVRAVYEAGQISAAADRLNVTQSAASVILAQAEAALGTRLFDRTTRRVVPTEAVEQIIGIVIRILDDVEAIGGVVTDLRELERGMIRIAATPATGIALLHPTVRRYRAAHPRIHLDLNDCAPDQFLQLVRDEKVDFGLGIPPADRTEFDWRPLHDDPLCLVCHQSHRLAGEPAACWADLDGEPLILARRNYGVRDQVEDTIRAAGGNVNTVNEIGFLYSAEWMVACDMGVAVFPSRLAQAIGNPVVSIVPLVEPVATRQIAIITKRGRSLSPPALRFAEMLAADLA